MRIVIERPFWPLILLHIRSLQMLLDDYGVKVNKGAKIASLRIMPLRKTLTSDLGVDTLFSTPVYAQPSSSRYSTEANPHEDLDRIIFPAFKRPGDSIKLRHP
jgi:hypothetical protein